MLTMPTTRRAAPRRYAVSLLVVLGALAWPAAASAQAERESFFEESAAANWSVAHECADGAVVQARLLVQSTYDFASPDTADAEPTARVQYQAICPDGTSYGWSQFACPVTHTSAPNLKRVHVSGTCTVRDTFGATHVVTIDVTWTGDGRLETSVNPTQGFGVGTSTRKQRAATATGTVTFDGDVLVSGPANHPIAPFIRTDEERFVITP
jgi:hypothetical protein